ncbi:WxcM-like protein [Marinifilum flexuosum]|uniref:WxcM-like protein n=2 Tax=Marinifilum flexuosum TaxID=1117708 RepID=A0A419X9E8_9BACT|nr:WxcM-like protein [Marinifilum flexuosum]
MRISILSFFNQTIMNTSIKKKHIGVISKKQHRVFKDFRGELTPLEFSELPFKVHRLFYVKNVPAGAIRGEHAHFQTKQFLICLKGQIEVGLETNNYKTILLNENEGVFIDKMIWDWQRFLTNDSILLVLCSSSYSKDDYIFDKQHFLDILNNEVSINSNSCL